MPYDLTQKAIDKAKPMLDYIESQLQAGIQTFIIPIAEPKPRIGFEHYKISPEELQNAMSKAIARCKLLIYQAIKASKHLGVPPYMNWDGVFKYSPVAGGLKITVKQGTFLTVSDELIAELSVEKAQRVEEIKFDKGTFLAQVLRVNQVARHIDVFKIHAKLPDINSTEWNHLMNALSNHNFDLDNFDARDGDPEVYHVYTYKRKGGELIGKEE